MDDCTRTASSSSGRASSTEPLTGTLPERGADPLPMPAQIDRYELLGVLGRGGMGTVYAAHDPKLDRKVALKLLDTLHESERLRREARALARLSHENVVQIFDVGTDECGRVYVVMEIIEGKTLRDWLAVTPRRPWPEVVRVLEAAGRGLAAAHALGLVHRDFKPGNVLIGHDGRVCVVDFGLARTAEGYDLAGQTSEGELSSQGSLDEPLSQAQITETGAVVGTPAYMAPEQWLRGAVDRRADVFGFCVTAWEALYGMRPFSGSSARAVAQRVLRGLVDDPPPGSDVPSWLHDALRRGLYVDPADRHPSMDAVLQALAGPPPRRRRGVIAAAGLVLVTSGGAAAIAIASREPAPTCAGMSAPMDELWTPERSAAIATTMRSSGPSYAQAAWERIEPTLSAYAAAWSDARTRACEARRAAEPAAQPQAERTFDLRMRCLEQRRVALATLLDVLEAAAPAAIEGGASLAWRLPAIDDCDDLDALQRREDRPDDPTIRDAVDAARSRLARARVLVDAGRYVEVLAETDVLLAEAERLAFDPLTIEIRLVRGDALLRDGRIDDGEALLERVHLDAVEAGRVELAMPAALMRAHVLSEAGRLDEAAELLVRTRSMWRAAGEPAALGVRLSQQDAQLALRRGDYPAARELLEQGVHHERMLGDDGPDLADALANLSTIEQLMGDLEPARAHCAEALEIRERTQGSSHPDVALDLHNLAITYAMQGQLDQAEPLLERSLAIKIESLGREHPTVAASLSALGTVAMERGRSADAERRFDEALALLERLHGPEHPELYYSLFGLAQLHLERDPPTGARELLLRSIALLEKTGGPSHPELAAPLRKLGELELREQHPAAAIVHLRRAVELSAGIIEDPVEAADLRLLLARALWDGGGDRAQASELVRAKLSELAGGKAAPNLQAVRADLERWLAEHPWPPP